MLHGRLLAESMKVGRDLQVAGLRLTHLGRHDVSGSVSATQPGVWTFVDYEAPDDVADELARQLARILMPEDGWYADFEVGDDHVVVFADAIFRYRKGDTAARQRAVDHGLAAGTPAHQLDWGE